MKPWMSTGLLAVAFVALFLACTTPRVAEHGGVEHKDASVTADVNGSNTSEESSPDLTSLEAGTLPDHWIDGTDESEPAIQVHAYNDDLYILRQSKRTNYEAPFMYLIFGAKNAILLDTGSRGDPPLRATVDTVLKKWCAREGRDDIHLIVGHTHGHGDHIANDHQFDDRPNTTFVSARLKSVKDFYGITDWPNQLVEFDLGQRILDIIPTPGHHRAHLVFYDRRTGLLLSGDTFYPGFLFVFRPQSWPDFRASTRRLVEFVDRNPITTILGCHVEMTNKPKYAFAYRTKEHPNERRLELTVADLKELDAAVASMGDEPRIEPHDSFIVYPAWKAERFGAPPPVGDPTK